MRNPLHNPTQSCRLLIYVKIKLSKDNIFILNSFQYIFCPDKDYMLKKMLQLNFDRWES